MACNYLPISAFAKIKPKIPAPSTKKNAIIASAIKIPLSFRDLLYFKQFPKVCKVPFSCDEFVNYSFSPSHGNIFLDVPDILDGSGM